MRSGALRLGWRQDSRKVGIRNENLEKDESGERVEGKENFGDGFAGVTDFETNISDECGLELLAEGAVDEIVLGHC